MYGNNYPIFDALILLPSLGFPAIAEKREDGNYEIFVSMLCITPANESVDFTLSIPEILGIEEFITHLETDLIEFRYITKISDLFNNNLNIIMLLTSMNSRNRVYWIPQNNFIAQIKEQYKKAYAKIRNMNQNQISNIRVSHIEFMLTLPQDLPSGLYNLVCKHERDSYKSIKSSFQYVLKSMINYKSSKDNIVWEEFKKYCYKKCKVKEVGPDLSKTSDGKPIIPYHPVYIPWKGKKYLNIAHISDTHVSRRWNAMAHWANEYSEGKLQIQVNKKDCSIEAKNWANFNNPNRRFEEALQKANENSNVDIIIITGDLIDYNRGYYGNKDSYFKHGVESYYKNYNWILFYELLLKNYNKPVFTILGNHDYRLNPYGIIPEWLVTIPTSSPVPSSIYTPPAKIDVVRLLGININYADDLGIKVKGNNLDCLKKVTSFIYPEQMTKYWSWGCELITDYENVNWYNLVINPALDYMFTYGDMGFLFLDWRENEEIFTIRVKDFLGKYGTKLEKNFLDELIKRISLPLPSFMKDFIALMKSFEKFGTPWAEDVLTKKQRDMIIKIIKKLENKKAVLPTLIVSMHPTVFCGPSISYNDGKIVRDESRDDDIQQHLALGNFKKHRHWFIKQMYNFTRSGGRAIVLSGHAHKNRVYTIEDCKVGSKVKNIDREERKEKGEKKEKKEKKKKELPLFFIVTTSSAYISKEANSPGFRILTFKNQGKQMDVACVRLR